jgi:hypothetical protein
MVIIWQPTNLLVGIWRGLGGIARLSLGPRGRVIGCPCIFGDPPLRVFALIRQSWGAIAEDSCKLVRSGMWK